MRNNDVRKITDGAMMLAIIGIFLLISRQLAGLFDGSMIFLLPLPMVFYAAKYGMKDSWVVLVSIVLLCVMLGSVQIVFYVGSESFVGMIYGSGIKKKTDTGKLVFFTMIMAVLIDILTMLVFAGFFGFDVNADIAMYKEMLEGISYEGVSLTSLLGNVDNLLLEVVIIATIMTGIMEGFLTHMLAKLMLKRLRFPVDKMKPVSSYYPPKWSGYLGLACFILYQYTAMNPFADDTVQIALQCLGLAGTYYLIVFGLIGGYVFAKERFHAGAWVILVLIAAVLLFNLAVLLFGFMYISTDMHSNMREEVDPHA